MEQNSKTITVPAGTLFSAVLNDPISTKTAHRGDNFHVQMSAPVAVEGQVVIPAGTFIQGTIAGFSRRGDRGIIRLRAAQLILPGSHLAAISGPARLLGGEGTAQLNLSTRTKGAAMLAPVAGGGIGAAIGAAAHTTQTTTLGGQTITSNTLKGIGIGSVVGVAAGAVVSLALILRSHEFDMQEGAPLEMTLSKPLTLSQQGINEANWAVEDRPVEIPAPNTPAPIPGAPSQPATQKICYTPTTPGTPPTVIPGPPGPNGIPGPPTVIPGTPPRPGTPYPCP